MACNDHFQGPIEELECLHCFQSRNFVASSLMPGEQCLRSSLDVLLAFARKHMH